MDTTWPGRPKRDRWTVRRPDTVTRKGAKPSDGTGADGPGSNRRHSAWEADVLPLNYAPREQQHPSDAGVEGIRSPANGQRPAPQAPRNPPATPSVRRGKPVPSVECPSPLRYLDLVPVPGAIHARKLPMDDCAPHRSADDRREVGQVRRPRFHARRKARAHGSNCAGWTRCGSTRGHSATLRARAVTSSRARPTTGCSIYRCRKSKAIWTRSGPPAWRPRQIGFTGGEPFMNPELVRMLGSCPRSRVSGAAADQRDAPHGEAGRCLGRPGRARRPDHSRLSRPLPRGTARSHPRRAVVGAGYAGSRLAARPWLPTPTSRADSWKTKPKLTCAPASPDCSGNSISAVDAFDPARLVLFPVMDRRRDVPEITQSCWQILDVDPDTMMCASSPHGRAAKRGTRPCGRPVHIATLRRGTGVGHQTLRRPPERGAQPPPFVRSSASLGGANCSAS